MWFDYFCLLQSISNWNYLLTVQFYNGA
uniref:Uncharacterized protein n=1 Tax=Anguilla anguilla TaxID=7936 RepID=A0A0E9QHF1_ANGAN